MAFPDNVFTARVARPFTPPAIAAARRFDPRQHRRFVIDDIAFGWIRERDVGALTRWPNVFTLHPDAVTLSAALSTPEARSEALGAVIRMLADEGRITGWRDEVFAVRNAFDDRPVALIERAASRFFGTMTYAVHVNGILPAGATRAEGPAAAGAADPERAAPRLWIARRSPRKAVDPNMLDTLVGGGIGWGWGIRETLAKECWEESGIEAAQLGPVRPGRTIHVLAEIEQGTQAEQLFVFDLPLDDDFTPHAEDGEVAEHLCVSIDEALEAVASGRMTVDASLATLDCALREGWLDVDAVAGFASLLIPPVPASGRYF